MTGDGIVAVGLLTRDDLNKLGTMFTRSWPVDETPCFGDLLRAIDDADREIRGGCSIQPAKEETG